MADPTTQSVGFASLTSTSYTGANITGVSSTNETLCFHFNNTTDRTLSLWVEASTDAFSTVTNVVSPTISIGVGSVTATNGIITIRSTTSNVMKLSGTTTAAATATLTGTTTAYSTELVAGDLVRFGATDTGDYYTVTVTPGSASAAVLDRALTVTASAGWRTRSTATVQQTTYRIRATYASGPTVGTLTVNVHGTT